MPHEGGLNYNSDVFEEEFPLVKRFVHHLTYYRTLHAAYVEHRIQSEFWTHTIDAHILQAIINWCKVFGSDTRNPTHWKKLSQAQFDELQARFRNGLNKEGIAQKEWQNCWEEMTTFRNKYAAHQELDLDSPVPHLDLALKIAFYYDKWIRQVINPDIFDEPALDETVEKITSEVTPLIARLLILTKESQQRFE